MMRAIAKFYEFRLIDVFIMWLVNPKKYRHLKEEMQKYKMLTEQRWQ